MTKGDPGVWLAKRLKPGDLVFDVGANEGHCAEHYLKAGATVYAFEPDGRCWEELERRAAGARIFHLAVGAETQHDVLTLGTTTAQSSLRPEAVDVPAGTVLTLTMQLDDLMEIPAAVKVDVQGGELDVLRGATRLVSECPLWVLEIWPHGLPRQAETVADIYRIFESAGKSPHTIEEPPQRLTFDDLMAWCAQARPYKFINLAWYGD